MIDLRTTYRTTALRLCLSLCALFLVAGAAQAQTVSFSMRAVNLIFGVDSVDVHLENREQPTINGLEYAYASQVLKNLQASGTFNVKLVRDGSGVGNPLIGADFSVQSGREYTALGYGSVDDRKIKVLERSQSQVPASDTKTLVRVMHAGRFDFPVDIRLGDVDAVPLFSSVKKDSLTGYMNVDAQATGLFVTIGGTTTPIGQAIAPFGADMRIVTLIVTGAGQNTLIVYALDETKQTKTPLISLEQTSTASVRLVNLLPNPGSTRGDSLDIYLSAKGAIDQIVGDSLGYLWVSQLLGSKLPGEYTAKFAPVGEGAASSILNVDFRAGADSAYLVVLTQFRDQRTTPMILTRTPASVLPPDFSKRYIRFGNATDFFDAVTAEVIVGAETLRFENLAFRGYTEFRELPSGDDEISVRLLDADNGALLFAGSWEDANAETGYLTLLALGNDEGLGAGVIRESDVATHSLVRLGEAGTDVRSGESLARGLELSVAPNPAVSNATVSIGGASGDVEITLFDVLGRRVLLERFSEGRMQTGARVSIPVGELLPGTYTCVISDETGARGSARFVVSR